MSTFRGMPFNCRVFVAGQKVLVIVTCRVTDKQHKIELDREDFIRWQEGEHIQDVWPNMSVDDREMLISGTTPEEWDMLFDAPEEEG